MFAGLSIALSSLYAQRQAIETTGHNIANANTEGYTRQRVNLQGVGGSAVPAFYSQGNSVGRGVAVGDIERLRDAFLEIRGQQEHALDKNYTTTQSVYQRVELLFAEPGNTGLQNQLADFWSSFDDVAARPGDGAARSQLIEKSKTLTSSFNKAATDLDSLKSDNANQLKSRVAEINSMASQVGDECQSVTERLDRSARSARTEVVRAGRRDDATGRQRFSRRLRRWHRHCPWTVEFRYACRRHHAAGRVAV